MVARARRPDHVRAQGDGDLHRVEPDPARGAVDQHPVALADVERLGQRLVGGQPGERQRPGLGERQRLRLVRQAALRRGHELGRRPPLDVVPADVAEHLVAGRERDHRGADRLDDAGDVPARDDREVVREGARQAAGADAHVDRVDAGGVHPHQHGVRPDRRLGAGRRAASGRRRPRTGRTRSRMPALTGGPSRTGRTPSGSRGGSRARRGRAACRRTSCPSPARGWP